MPVPPNTTPATATDVSALLPYSITISAADFTLAPAGSIVSSCDAHPEHTLWWVYTAPVDGPTAIGITVGDPDIVCAISAWLGPASAPTQITDACMFVSYDPDGLQINVAAGVPIYIMVDTESDPVTSDVTIAIEAGAQNISPAGSLLVTNDTPGFPAAILSAADLSILWMLALPSSEMADSVPTGEVAILAEGTNPNLAVSVNVYDQNLTLIAANSALVIGSQSSVSPLRGNGSGLFYVLCQTSSKVVPPVLKTIDLVGVAGPTWALPALTHNTSVAMAPNRADTIVYYAERNGSTTIIHAYDLIGSAPLADLVTIADVVNGRDILVLATGDLLIAGVGFFDSFMTITRVNTAGVVQATYNLGAANVGSVGRIALALDDPNSFWIMWFPSTGVSRFENIKVSDGSVLFTDDRYSWAPGGNNHGETFGPSKSCPLVLLAQDATPPSPVACDAATVLTQPTSQYVELGASVTICTQFVVPGSPRQCQIDYVGPIIPIGGIFTGCGSSDPGTITLCLTVPVVTQTFTFNVTVTICPGEEDEVSTTSDDATVTVTSGGTGPGGGMRRLRRFKLPTQENKEIFFSKLEILLQRGVGLTTGQGSDPQMLIRLSKNGGKTWGTEIAVPAGKQGQFSRRAMLRRLGRARNAVVEISVSDPVYWGLLAAYVKLDEGTS